MNLVYYRFNAKLDSAYGSPLSGNNKESSLYVFYAGYGLLTGRQSLQAIALKFGHFNKLIQVRASIRGGSGHRGSDANLFSSMGKS